MMEKVFISGSISIKELPPKVEERLDNMINKFHILVGDADGIDSAVQNYFSKKGYYNLTVYSIREKARHKKSDKFILKTIDVDISSPSEREKQREKDKAMTFDSNYCFIIWDQKSLGSFYNIIRALEQNKPVLVYSTRSGDFIEKHKVTIPEISYMYYDLNGYSGQEIIEILGSDIPFKNTREMNKYLREHKILEKKQDIEVPCKGYEALFINNSYKGKPSGIKYSMKFTEWIVEQFKQKNKVQDGFDFGQ